MMRNRGQRVPAYRYLYGAMGCLVLAGLFLTVSGEDGASRPFKKHLSETGLYSNISTKTIAPADLMYSPQYPLWSDGAKKKRWIYLPPGTTIDASHVDNWVYPIGTKVWKEFSFDRPVETRLMVKTGEGKWIYATYKWNADNSDADLVPEEGMRNVVEIAPGVGYNLPSVNDCKACHEGSDRDVVLGFNALQLSPDRDPLAPHADKVTPEMINLQGFIQRGLLAHLPKLYAKKPPRINARSPRERAAVGYLWANCGGCHNSGDPLSSVGMYLKLPLDSESSAESPKLENVIGQPSKFQIPGMAQGMSERICPGDTLRSAIIYRMESRNPVYQMPPLDTKIADREALNLITQWIEEDLGNQSKAHHKP